MQLGTIRLERMGPHMVHRLIRAGLEFAVNLTPAMRLQPGKYLEKPISKFGAD